MKKVVLLSFSTILLIHSTARSNNCFTTGSTGSISGTVTGSGLKFNTNPVQCVGTQRRTVTANRSSCDPTATGLTSCRNFIAAVAQQQQARGYIPNSTGSDCVWSSWQVVRTTQVNVFQQAATGASCPQGGGGGGGGTE